MTTTPAAVLRLAQAVPETPENYPILRELVHALQDLVDIADQGGVMSQRMPDYESLRAAQARSQEGHVHDLTKSVWCPKCEHTHVPNIPQWTWRCRECGFGSWFDSIAARHETLQPTHHVYAEEHPVVPLSERPKP